MGAGTFQRATEGDMRRHFIHILDHATKDSDYKFALARFLLDHSKDSREARVPYDRVAEHFLRTYWNQTKMRHTTKKPRPGGGERTLGIVKIMEKNLGKSYRPRFERMWKAMERDAGLREAIQRAVQEAKSGCFHDVTWRFESEKFEGGRETGMFFRYKERSVTKESRNRPRRKMDIDEGLALNPRAMGFFRDNYYMLSKFVTLEWARFLEKVNPGMPRIVEKAEGSVKRGSLAKYQRILARHFPMECFYCGTGLEKGEVDHVIPFSYIAEDELWNLVLACRECNCSKLGSLPREQDMKKLIRRNARYGSRIAELSKSLGKLDGDFERELRRHYESARDCGFVEWGGRQA